MAVKLHSVNDKLLAVDIEEIAKQRITWTTFMMVSIEYSNILREITVRNNLAASILSLLCTKLTQHSPFIEISQKDMATTLNSAESHISTAVKLLLENDPKILIRVCKGVFAVSPLYVWRFSMVDRTKWLNFIKLHGYARAYEVHKAGRIMEEFNATIRQL